MDEVATTSTEQAAAPTSMAEVSAPTATADLAARIAADMDRYLPSFDRYEQVRAVLVFHDGEPILERYLSGAGPDDYWDVRSVTKSVVSALIGIAIDQGNIDGVDQTLGDLLPDYGDVMTPEVAAITLRQVLTHTAGFSESWEDVPGLPFWESDDWIRAILADRAAAGPGDGSFAYSDAGAHLLSAVLTEATGQSVLEFARAYLFDPLGIPSEPAVESISTADEDAFWSAFFDADFAWLVDPQEHHIGSAMLKLRPQDLARLGQLYLDGGQLKDDQLVSASWVEASTSPQVDAYQDMGSAYGYLWWVTEIGGDPAYYASGLGGQIIAVAPNRDLVVVVATEFDERDDLRFEKAPPGDRVFTMVETIAAHFGNAD